jgi:predicted ABC-type ATPase
MSLPLDRRPLIVAIAGPNGAGKSRFYQAFVARAGLRLINANDLARAFDLEPYVAAARASELRQHFISQKESFAFETVLSDPVGEKVQFLRDAAASGYNVVFCFIGLHAPDVSEERVAMRVLQGGHDVPSDKLYARFPRTLQNLALAVSDLPHVQVFDNSELAHPFRRLAVFENGSLVAKNEPSPDWLWAILPVG